MRIYSQHTNILIHRVPVIVYRSENDALQNTVLLFINKCYLSAL